MMSTLQGTLCVDARATLGECALWCDVAQALWWTDIQSSTLHRRSADGSLRQWSLPERVGSFALTHDPSVLLLGLASRVALFDFERDRLTAVADIAADQPTTRINDGRCDPQGRFVFGLFNEAADGAPICGWYRVATDLSVETLPLPPASCANSLAFSPDGATLYFCDSGTREIRCCDYRADGLLGPPRRFARLADAGFPDGSTVDAEGGLWNAQWEGSRVVRYDSGGRETARIELPATRITCPAFGGPQLDRLYVTSARGGLDAAALATQPAAGGVFEATPGWRGLPERRFAGVGARR